jgi:hypothetical protein
LNMRQNDTFLKFETFNTGKNFLAIARPNNGGAYHESLSQ